ncbi:MAG: exosome complex RNA-binding protein Rrp4 [Desulfurococcales archaeon]|nr:exosome complex RNA-binding protein Rrp4 [Desulfurococcales archaeon]MEB3779899.1 exosome complex RNA-binding protein Rrp4 [Desulfurococcales archaeon]
MQGKDRVIVVPGEILPKDTVGSEQYLIEADSGKMPVVVGLLDMRGDKPSFIPLKGTYIPKRGDIVIGLIVSQGVMNWFVDIKSPYNAVLNVSDFLGRPFNPMTDDMSKMLQIGDYIKAKVEAFDRSRSPVLSVQEEGLGRIVEGKVIDVDPTRIPRIVGKKKSMLSMLIEETGCDIYPAVNGRVHVKCDNPDMEAIVILAIKRIEREAHTVGLTERIKRFIEEEKSIRGV